MDHVHNRAELFAAEKASSGMVHNGVRVVDSNPTACRYLYIDGGHPGTVDVFICIIHRMDE